MVVTRELALELSLIQHCLILPQGLGLEQEHQRASKLLATSLEGQALLQQVGRE